MAQEENVIEGTIDIHSATGTLKPTKLGATVTTTTDETLL